MKNKIKFGAILLMGLLIAYLLLWPVPINPVAWTPPIPPDMTGNYALNTYLEAVEKLGTRAGVGPEGIAINQKGDIYAGLADGRILIYPTDGSQPSLFVNTEGRPLGMEFDKAGNLIVADGDKGLLSINLEGNITTLNTQVDGPPLKLIDDLAIASDGTIYFSDASYKFSFDDFTLDLLEHLPNGRFLVYNPHTQSTQVLLTELYFANGVALSPDESFVLISETWKYHIRRYWLAGPKQGQSDIFISNLPGFPDNITFNGKNIFWVTLTEGPATRQTVDSLLPYPFLRKIALRLPKWFQPASIPVGYVLGLDLNGQVIYNLQDLSGNSFHSISSAIEYNDMLYLGSISEDAIGRIAIP